MASNPDRRQRSALTDIESRITVLERRLRNARAARDSYVDYLRGKYPSWKPSLSPYQRKLKTDEHLVSKLATSNYHWEGHRTTFPRPAPGPPDLYQQIPRRGPFMESDFQRTRERLNLMSHQLRILRDARLNMATDDYFRTRGASTREAPREVDEIPSLDGVRKRLADMSFSLMEPPTTPTQERIEEMQRIDSREKLIRDIRAGVLPSVTADIPEARPPSRPGTASIVEESKGNTAAQASTTPGQLRIQFANKKPPAAAPTVPSTPAPTTPAPTKKEESSNPFSRIMGLLGKSDSTDSEEIAVSNAPAAPTLPPSPKLAAPQPVLGSLSQYLQKSSTPTASTSSKPAPTMFGSFSGGAGKIDDSDDDFFD